MPSPMPSTLKSLLSMSSSRSLSDVNLPPASFIDKLVPSIDQESTPGEMLVLSGCGALRPYTPTTLKPSDEPETMSRRSATKMWPRLSGMVPTWSGEAGVNSIVAWS